MDGAEFDRCPVSNVQNASDIQFCPEYIINVCTVAMKLNTIDGQAADGDAIRPH